MYQIRDIPIPLSSCIALNILAIINHYRAHHYRAQSPVVQGNVTLWCYKSLTDTVILFYVVKFMTTLRLYVSQLTQSYSAKSVYTCM
jgi:hypothetical protein